MKEKLLIIGAGGHAKSCVDVIEKEGKFEILGFVDNDANIKKVFEYEVLGCDDDLPRLFKTCKFAFLGIGQIKSPDLRVKLFKRLKSIGFCLPTIISPLAYVSKHAFISNEASIIMHQALINTNAKIGKACIINTKALIEHDAVVEDFCHISTAAVVNGECKVAQKSFVGSNSMLKHTQNLAEQSVFFAGKNLTRGGGAL
ncbi:NeuD/PglB/VioB family sugar acetyltransferase [Campylobacter sp. MIT 97-5078]|uniref:NeuD/PglB/VioB family sugar acetyltransferase n=1 Tax=Campylobacter sp. MIT 97-5078 TaxID=1548153 RepID=UPI000513FBFA|nr:NeuD/PglB/VioB family sugar acetyltransferase [Campylobacter sp. MIT 97-5078]KGI55913.1 acetyltransferase [Campylobacter sp. MIT 97-5078]TQR27644.1 acetyltransferase [Campylobacter sp. MIT 97-5078]